MGIPPKDHGAYFDEEEVGSTTLFNPDRGYSARGSMVTPFDSYANQFEEFQAGQNLSALDGRKELLASGTQELLAPEGRDRRLSYLLQGVTTPQEEYAMQRMEPRPIKPPAINKYSPVPTEVVQASAELDFIDPTSPDALEKRNEILRQVDAHPEFGNSNVRAHPFFVSKDQNLMRNILAAKGRSSSDEQREAKRKELSALESRQLDLAAQGVPPISDDRKKSAFERVKGRPPQNDAEWRVAYGLADAEISPQRQALRQIVEDLKAMGKSVPQRYVETAGLSVEESAQPVEQQDSVPRGTIQTPVPAPEGRIQVTTRAQYDALPSGTKAIDSKGQPFTKK